MQKRVMGARAEREAYVRGRAGNAAPNASNAHGRECRLPLPGGKSVPGVPGKAGYSALHAGGKAGQRKKALARGKFTPVCRRATKSRF